MQDTRAAVLTSAGHGAIACVAVQGPRAADAVAECFEPASKAQQAAPTIRFGRWRSNGEELVVADVSEEYKEVHCHGGAAAVRCILHDLCAAGCVSVTPSELCRSNPLSHVAMVAVSHARTQRAASLLLAQSQGGLERGVRALLELVDTEQLERAGEQLERIEEWAFWGERLLCPWTVAIVGQPNVGKSSLMNCLLGYQRSIVVDQPGTTRDVVTMATAVDGWLLKLADTAGVRATSDDLESQGIGRAKRLIAEADAAVMVSDGSRPWDEQDDQICELAEQSCSDRLIVVHNKSDLQPACQPDDDRPSGVIVSCKTRQGLDHLLAQLRKLLTPRQEEPEVISVTPQMTAAFRAVGLACRSGDQRQAQWLLQNLLLGQFDGRLLVESVLEVVRS